MLRKFLPQTSLVSLRIVIVSICLLYVAEFVGCLSHAQVSQPLWIILALGLWLPLALGLWLMKNIARVVAVVVHWLLFFIIPIGALSPFAAMDNSWGRTPLWVLFSVVVVLGAANCYVIFMLGKHKDQFSPLRHKAV